MRSLKHPMSNQDIVNGKARQEWENFTNRTLLYNKETIRNMWLLYLKQERLGFLTWVEMAELLEFWLEL